MSNRVTIDVLLIAQPAAKSSCIKHQLAHSTKCFVFFFLLRLSERIWVRSGSEHRTLSLNWRTDTKATSSTVQHVGILRVSARFVLLLTITGYSQRDLVNQLSDAVISHSSIDTAIQSDPEPCKVMDSYQTVEKP